MDSDNVPRRFSDIGTINQRILAPIEGYENLPIVNLEKAIEPLIALVPKIERNVYIIKKNCLRPRDGLTIDESASIMLYTSESIPQENSLYFKLNATLRSEDRQALKPWFLYLRLMLGALVRLPSECCVVFRGVKKNLSEQYMLNETVMWWAFSSCTSSVDVLKKECFFGTTGDRTLFIIKSDTAKNIRNHSCTQTENEMLLLPARQFQVEAFLDCGNGPHIVQLKETKPTYDLLEQIAVPNAPVPSQAARHTMEQRLSDNQLRILAGEIDLPCNGHHCNTCGKCRDWRFTGDEETWQWMQNYQNWTGEDKARWCNNNYYYLFKLRDGAKCNRSLYYLGGRLLFSLLSSAGYTGTDLFGHICVCTH